MPEQKHKSHIFKKIIKALLLIGIFITVIVLTLFIASKIGNFESISAMLEYIRVQLS